MKKENDTVKKKIKPWKKIVILIGSVLIVIAIASTIFIYTTLSKIKNYQPEAAIAPNNETFETDSQETNDNANASNPDDVIWPSAEAILNDPDVFNILLIGQDRRPDQGRQRSDSMILVSYSKKDKTIKLISLMRDMYVQIPGYSDNGINAAYAFGGMELLDKTIAQNFGVMPDGNFEVDFDGFIKVIDVLGGVDINLTDYDAEYLNNVNKGNLITGTNHLNGEQSLQYARIRYVGNADFERTERQRNVVVQVLDKVLLLDIAGKLEILDELLPYLTTDMSKNEIIDYSLTVLQSGIIGIEQYRIPVDGAYTSSFIREMYVLVPDLDKNREQLKEFILGKP